MQTKFCVVFTFDHLILMDDGGFVGLVLNALRFVVGFSLLFDLLGRTEPMCFDFDGHDEVQRDAIATCAQGDWQRLRDFLGARFDGEIELVTAMRDPDAEGQTAVSFHVVSNVVVNLATQEQIKEELIAHEIPVDPQFGSKGSIVYRMIYSLNKDKAGDAPPAATRLLPARWSGH